MTDFDMPGYLDYAAKQFSGAKNPMTSAEFSAFVSNKCGELAATIKEKNRDYSGLDNPFSNLDSAKEFGLPPIQGLLLRMNDKMGRLKTWSKSGLQGESAEDSLLDIAGYAIQALALLERDRRG